jgi:hypothetical protein
LIRFHTSLNHFTASIFFLLFSILLVSCAPEQKLAKGFVNMPPSIDLQLFTPISLFKFNHKGEEIEGFDELSEFQQDSALYANSMFIRSVDDSLFMDHYMNSFIDELRTLGFAVYLDNAVDSFLKQRPQAYVVNVSQVQLDEYKFPVEDTEPWGDSILYQSFQLDAVDASSWFELSKVNSPNPKKTVLYSTFTASDGFEGRFVMNGFTFDVQYKYKIDSLKARDIYELADYAGKKNASYLFDFFLNQYIAITMESAGTTPQYWLHYNRFSKKFVATQDEMFEVLPGK